MANISLTRWMRYLLEAAFAYAFYGLFRLLSPEMASDLGGLLARWLGPLSGAHKTADTNLIRSLPNLTTEERRAVMSNVWDNFGRVMAEYASLSRLWQDNDRSRVEVFGTEYLQALANQGAPAIIFSGHLANWEVTALAIGWTVKPPAMVYRAPNNPLVERLLQSARGPATSSLIPKGRAGARNLVRALHDGEFIAMAIDQKINTGIPVPLFDRDAMTGEAIARLALRFNCPIIPARTVRVNGCKFKVIFEEPWTIESTGDLETDVCATLARINNKLENWIRDQPGQWLWLHNRWPKDESKS